MKRNPEIEQELQQLKLKLGLRKADETALVQRPPAKAKPATLVPARQRPTLPWRTIKIGLLAAGLVGGGLGVANLPYPFIRQTVQKVAPFALIPSYASWNYHYRQAIPLAEQADQLINHPTSAADLERADAILKQAQDHVEALPITFSSDDTYYHYRHGFTYDQFGQLRQSIGQMTAKLFQEHQSQQLLNQAELELNGAKTQYQKATTTATQAAAVNQWAAALSQFRQISSDTLAGQTARTRLEFYQMEYSKINPEPPGSA